MLNFGGVPPWKICPWEFPLRPLRHPRNRLEPWPPHRWRWHPYDRWGFFETNDTTRQGVETKIFRRRCDFFSVLMIFRILKEWKLLFNVWNSVFFLMYLIESWLIHTDVSRFTMLKNWNAMTSPSFLNQDITIFQQWKTDAFSGIAEKHMCVRRSDCQPLNIIKQRGLSCTLLDNVKMWRLRMDFWVSVPLHFTLNKVEGETAVPTASPSKTSNSQNCTTYLNVPKEVLQAFLFDEGVLGSRKQHIIPTFPRLLYKGPHIEMATHASSVCHSACNRQAFVRLTQDTNGIRRLIFLDFLCASFVKPANQNAWVLLSSWWKKSWKPPIILGRFLKIIPR